MSETSKQPNEKITSDKKSEKIKDPRKVELGKRLAKISREAKERKARMRSEADREAGHERTRFAKEINDYVDFRYFVGGVMVVALWGLYYAYKRDQRQSEEFKQSERERSEWSEREDKKVKTINKNEYETTKCKPSKCFIENL